MSEKKQKPATGKLKQEPGNRELETVNPEP
jgi:hypothetical protein